MKIGIVGDTHIPTLSPLLPFRIAELFKGLDIIFHVGDICELYVLEELQETYTLTFAVFGERDSDQVKTYLDERRVVKFGERRVGMIHGHQFNEYQKQAQGGRLWRIFGRKPPSLSLEDFLLQQFAEDEVDAIVFGHTHQPYVKMYQGVLLFNPGPALPGRGRRPSVGILEMDERRITGKIVYL